MWPALVALLVLAIAAELPAKSPSNPRLVALKDLDGADGEQLKARARDVVLIAPREDVIERADGIRFAQGVGTGLCKDQRFAKEQGVDTACSGVLVSKGLVLTAAHCLDQRPIGDWIVIFGHDGDATTPLRSARISAIRHCIPNNAHGDLVAFDLVEAIEPATRAIYAPPEKAGLVHLLGHPFGWAIKASTCSGPYDCEAKPSATQIGVDWFLADLDAFGGNSGSPVYSSDGRSLIGIWSSGPTTLERSNPRVPTSCRVYPARPRISWGGKATRVDGFMATVNAGQSLLSQCARAP